MSRYRIEVIPLIDDGGNVTGRMQIAIWDEIIKQTIKLPNEILNVGSTMHDVPSLLELLNAYCTELNRKYDDDILYVQVIKDYGIYQ